MMKLPFNDDLMDKMRESQNMDRDFKHYQLLLLRDIAYYLACLSGKENEYEGVSLGDWE